MRIWLYGLVVEPPFAGINIVAEDRGLEWRPASRLCRANFGLAILAEHGDVRQE
jgi:hypothetical protein